MREKRKRIEFSDDFMFATIMRREKDICLRVLECILEFEIENLNYVEAEYTIKGDQKAKGIRLDIVAKDTGATYDIEMQTVNTGNIPRRMRYYQSQIDSDELSSGQKYNDLKNSYIIFICTFDLFGQGKYVYEFENYDVKNKLPLNDGSKKIVINTKGTKGKINKELEEFIKYIEHPEKVESLQTELVQTIDEKVTKRNKDSRWRRLHMTFELYLQDREEIAERKGIEIGLEQGKELGMKKGERRGLATAQQVFPLFYGGKSTAEIASILNMKEKDIKKVLGPVVC